MNLDKTARLVFSLLMVVSLVCSPHAQAGDVYVSGALNRSHVDQLVDVDAADVPLDGDTSGMRLALGYEFNEHFAAEVAYTDFGDLNQSVSGLNLSAEADAQELALLGRLPLGERFAIFGRLAYVSWDGNIGVDNLVAGTSGDDVAVGAGLEFAVGESLSFALTATKYRLDDLDLAALDLGIRFRF